MNGVINIEYPESLANTLKLSNKDFAIEIKTSSILKLYELGKISSGVAANVLGINRIEFIELLGKYKISIFSDFENDDLRKEMLNA